MTRPDDDLGDRLRDVLRTGTDRAPVLADVAGAARARRTERVRHRAIAGAVAGALVLAGFAVALPHLNGESKGSPSPAAPVSTAVSPDPTPTDFRGRAWIPDGWRSETYDGIEMAVPDSWRYGDLDQSCILPDDNPVYDRPGGFSTAVGCFGPQGYGVRFEEPRAVDPDALRPDSPSVDGKPVREFPEGSAVRTATIGMTMVLLVLKDAALADRVIATVHAVGATDANGCTSTADVPGLGKATTVPDVGGNVSVCRYSPDRGRHLEESELLSGADSAAARAALAAAPVGTGPDASRKNCIDTPGLEEVVELRTTAGPLAWVHFADCRGHGIDLGSSTRQLTKDVMYWALSPGWSGGIDVPGVVDRIRDLPEN